MMRFFKTKIGIAILAVVAVLGFVYFVLPRFKKTTTAPAPTPTPASPGTEAPKTQTAKFAAPTVTFSGN